MADDGRRRWPVDVYSPEGERLFTGWITPVAWEVAHGDHVYALRYDAESGERMAVRYRMTTPF